MSTNSRIEWTEATWNPILGCTKVSPGCDHCYAITQATIRAGSPHPKVAEAFAGLTERTDAGMDWTSRVNLLPERLMQPVKCRKPKRWFVNSLADMFHDDVPDKFIAEVFAVMAWAGWHTFQLLTKRHGRLRSLMNDPAFVELVRRAYRALYGAGAPARDIEWPLPNVWIGVSAEDQHWAATRVHALLQTPAAVRWVSAEPLLGPIDLRNLKARNGALIDALCGDVKSPDGEIYAACPGSVSWVVAGGESGPGARPMQPDWARALRDQCRDAGVAFLFKQWGAHRWVAGSRWDEETQCWIDHGAVPQRVPKKLAGRTLDGRTWDEYPVSDLRSQTPASQHRGEGEVA
jgi:protein gp37